jgi:hypothetical protein
VCFVVDYIYECSIMAVIQTSLYATLSDPYMTCISLLTSIFIVHLVTNILVVFSTHSHWHDDIEFIEMIPQVWTVAVWSRAQCLPDHMEDWTELHNRLPILDWQGSVLTSPYTVTNLTLVHGQVLLTTQFIHTFVYNSPLNIHPDYNYDSSVSMFSTIKIYFSHSKTNSVINIT